jgi:hypothetical protein
MTQRIAFTTIIAFALALSARAAAPFPEFKVQEIDKTLKVGYGLKVVDLNKDGKPDVVVADSARVIWFDDAGGWKLHTIIDNAKAGVKPDNVCLDVADIDGDGKLDIALGADWQINNTSSGGALQWLRQGATIEEWTVHPIAKSIPTLHRIHFADIDGAGPPELLVGPIRGVGSTAAENYMDKPLRLLAYHIPKDPTGEWGEPRVIDGSKHHLHNFTPVDLNGDKAPEILTASAEGVGALLGSKGNWTWTHIGAGNQDNPKGARGSSEVKIGLMKGSPAYIVAIEPLHGNQLVTYRFGSHRDNGPAPKGPTGIRTIVDDQLKGGHALWCADLDGDGLDEIIAGFRESTSKGVYPGVNVYRADGVGDAMKWEKHVLEEKDMACEDLASADLNGDGRVDIVACGRATGNVRIYWNLGVPKP